MSFKRVPRGLIPQKKREIFGPREVVLMWTDNPPSPCLSIYVGRELAQAIGVRTPHETVQFFIGKDADAGRVGIKNVPTVDGDYRFVSHTWDVYRLYLPAHVSATYFEFSQRTTIPASQIEVRGSMLIFAHSGVKS